MKNTHELPFKSEEFRAIWDEWGQFRKEIKKPLTPTTINRQLKLLESFGEAGAIASISQSICSSWQGLFPPAKAITTSKTVHFTQPQHTPGSGF